MTKKIKVVCSSIWYPLSMSRYFERALERRDDVELITVGPHTGTYIPWRGGMHLPAKYGKSPTCPLPRSAISQRNMPLGMLSMMFPNIDFSDVALWLQVDAGWYLSMNGRENTPPSGVVAHVATDPHCLDYSVQRRQSNYFFCMQSPYMKQGDLYLPYGYDPTVHYPEDLEKEYDVCLVGLQYQQRNQVMQELKRRGLKIFYEIGHIFDEYRQINCKSKVGFNWSSLQDMNARAWELAAMGICSVQNTVPDMQTFFVPGEHYLPFRTVDQAVSVISEALSDDGLREEIGNNAYRKVTGGRHTWDDRVEEILGACGLI